jgi:excisionase family DNA binding protein
MLWAEPAIIWRITMALIPSFDFTPPGYLALDEAARRLDVSVDTLRRRVRSGKVRAVRIGSKQNGRIVIPLDALEA